MKKFLFLLMVAAFCLGCGTSTSTNTTTANKPNTNAATPAANKPAPANTTAPTNTSAPAKADEKSNPELDFTIVNKTGYDIKELSVGATGTGDWAKEDEVLKGKTFADGDSLEIKFSPRATAANWDIKVMWADGSGGEEWIKLDLTEIEKATLVYDKDKDETSAIIE